MGDLTRSLSRSEFTCKCGCGYDTVDWSLPTVIQACVNHFQDENPGMLIQVRINSGTRCKKHNASVGGGDSSKHLIAQAADIVIYDKLAGKEIHADKVADYFEETYPNSHGIGRYKGRTHIDTRSIKARWNNR